MSIETLNNLGKQETQISPERLRLYELGQLALTARETDILREEARAAPIRRLEIMDRLGFDPTFPVPKASGRVGEPLSDIGYRLPVSTARLDADILLRSHVDIG